MDFRNIIENKRSRLVASTCVLAGVGLSIVAGAELFGDDNAAVRSRRMSRAATTDGQDTDGLPAIARHVANVGGWHQGRVALPGLSSSTASAGTAAGGAESAPSAIVPIDGVMPTLSSATVARKANSQRHCERGVEHSGDSVVVTSCDPAADAEAAAAAAQAEVNSWRRPRQITVTPPQYHPGTLPSVTPPAVSATPPSVSRTDDSVTVTVNPNVGVTPPGYTPGQSGTLDPPSVIID